MLQNAVPGAAKRAAAVTLLEGTPLALARKATRSPRHATGQGGVGPAKTLRAMAANGRPLPDKTPNSALLLLAAGVVASAIEVRRNQLKAMTTHTADAQTGRTLAAGAVFLILPPGSAVGFTAEAIRKVAASPTATRCQVL